MADNYVANAGTGGDTFAADDIGGVKFVRVKLALGADGTNDGDVSAANPVPVSQPDLLVTGAITTQNLVPAGTATAGSAVEIGVVGKATLAVQVEGTFTGILSLQGRVGPSSAWVTITGPATLVRDTGAYSATIPSAGVGVYQTDCVGFTAVRIAALAAVTGTATINVRASPAVALTALDTPLPAGSAVIGSIATVSTLSAITAGANLIADVGVQYRANAAGAATVAKVQTAASTNATAVKASAARLLGWHLTNTTAAVKVVHVHNLAVAPTVGTSVPAFNIVLPPNATIQQNFPGGIGMATGLSYSITGAVADLDTTVTAANDVVGALFYA